jgi:hypothetical protein
VQGRESIRSLRAAKREIDPWKPIGQLWEEERTSDGGLEILALTAPFTRITVECHADLLGLTREEILKEPPRLR